MTTETARDPRSMHDLPRTLQAAVRGRVNSFVWNGATLLGVHAGKPFKGLVYKLSYERA